MNNKILNCNMQIYYYTRTGRGEKIARELHEKYGFEINQITDDKKWDGALNYLKAGAMACQKKTVQATYKTPNENDGIILIFPVWAGTFPPTVRSFLEKNARNKIIAITSSLGTKFKDRDGFRAIYDLVGKEISTPDLDHNLLIKID